MKRYMLASMVLLVAVGCTAEKKPRVSVITSLYNGQKFLAGFMEDMVKQTIFDQCELIIINAHSNQRVQEDRIIKPYVSKYENIRYIHLAENQPDPGIYGIWNLAIKEYARGDYIINANVDDRLKPDALELMANALDEDQSVDLVWGQFYVSHQPNQDWESCKKNNCVIWPSREFSLQALAQETLVGNHPMWRKSVVSKSGYFDPSYKVSGDWEMWCRMALAGSKFKKIPGALGVYYVNPVGLSSGRPDLIEVHHQEQKRLIAHYRPLLLAKERHAQIAA